jgi:polyhydroxybutyrate depolymerase
MNTMNASSGGAGAGAGRPGGTAGMMTTSPNIVGSAGSAGTTRAGTGVSGAGASMSAAGSGGMTMMASAGTGAAAGGGSGTSGNAAGASAGAGGSSAPDATCPMAAVMPGAEQEFMINSKNGLMYSYILRVPPGVDVTQRTPLLVHWHALGSDPEEARDKTSIDAKVDAANWLVVYPRSPDKSWDVGSCCTATVGGQSRDEEVFARELIADVKTKACIDEKRIYTNGFSNGGMISQFLACKMTDVFAASAPMGSTLTISQSMCSPSRPIPIFMINGTADPLVGYNAPSLAGGISVPDDVKFWADKNKCTGDPETFVMMGKATCTRYTNCMDGAEVAACAVDGMGHCVPGMKKESPTNCLTKDGIPLGMPNDDIDGLQMDMDFLKRFTLP